MDYTTLDYDDRSEHTGEREYTAPQVALMVIAAIAYFCLPILAGLLWGE